MSTPGSTIAGVIPVLPTTFESDGTLDRRSFREMADHVMGLDVRAVMFPGFASEYYKLDDTERRSLSKDLLDAASDHPDVTPILSVTSHATVVAARHARELVELGARGINLMPPHFMGPSAEDVEAHIATVLDAVDPVPVLLQYAPGDTGTRLQPRAIATIAAHHPNLVAVKVEARPPEQFIADLLRQDPPVPSFAGSGGLFLLNALREGAVGVQPGSSFAELYIAIWREWADGDIAEAQAKYARLLTYLVTWATQQEPIVAIDKRIAHRRGLIANETCRKPHHAITATGATSVERFLDEFAAELHVPDGSRYHR